SVRPEPGSNSCVQSICLLSAPVSRLTQDSISFRNQLSFPCVCVSLFCIVFKDRFCAACESFLLSLADSLVIISPFLGFVNPIFQLFLRLHISIHRKSERSIHVQFLSFEISRHSTSHTLIMRPIFSIFFRMK